MELNQELVREYNEYVQELADKGVIAGAAIMVTDREYKTVYQNAVGYADLSLGKPATVDTLWQIMSMSKTFCNAAVMRLVDQGKIDLDKEAGDYLACYKNPLVIDHWDEENDLPVLRPAKTPLTIRSLLNCTAGVATQAAYDSKRYHWESRFMIGFASEAQWHAPLSFDPGTDWAYNAGWNILAEIVLDIDGNGRDWGDYLNDTFFRPLELHSTTCKPYGDPLLEPRLSMLHNRQPDNTLVSFRAQGIKGTPWFGSDKTWPAYGGKDATNCVFSSARDFCKWLTVFLNHGVGANGVRVLSDEAVEEMRRNQIGDLVAHWVTDKIMIPNSFEEEPDFFFGQQPMKWGLGVLVNEEETLDGRGKNAIAWFGGGDTYFTADIENGLSIMVGMAQMPSAHPASVSIFRNVERLVHGLPLIKVDPKELEKKRQGGANTGKLQ